MTDRATLVLLVCAKGSSGYAGAALPDLMAALFGIQLLVAGAVGERR